MHDLAKVMTMGEFVQGEGERRREVTEGDEEDVSDPRRPI